MPDKRRLGHCDECGEDDRKMATKVLCQRCYLRQHRETLTHAGAVKPEHDKLIGAYAKLMTVFRIIKTNEDDLQRVLRLLAPYFAQVADRVELHLDAEGLEELAKLENEEAEMDREDRED